MSLLQRKALGALLAVISVSPPLACADSYKPPPPSDEKTKADLSSLLSRAKKLNDSDLTSARPAVSDQKGSLEEASRARHILDRYYAISAEAQAANDLVLSRNEASAGQVPKQLSVSSSARKRTPAQDTFEQFDTKAISGPVCKRYVICGGGTAAWAAIDAILKEDSSSAHDILLITEESYWPYNRTMLSKELWEPKDMDSSMLGLRAAAEYSYRNVKDSKVSALCDTRVISVDTDEKAVELSNGLTVHFDKLLLATGGVPRSPASVSTALAAPSVSERVSVFRSLDDFVHLRDIVSDSKAGVVVIGGGFLGTELAIALASTTENVSLVIAEAGVLFRVLPRYLCEFLARKISELGVKVVCSAIVTDAKVSDTPDATVTVQILSPDANEVQGGRVIVATGIDPETKLAAEAGLELDKSNGGVVVNDFMMAQPDVFVAGDAASFHDRTLGRRRVEHWDHAVVTGRIAGQNMVGKRARYGLQSMFWSDLTNIGTHITAVGLVDSKFETVSVWNTSSEGLQDAPAANDFDSGVVYYLDQGEIVGVVLWNPSKGSGALRRARALVDARTNVSGLSDSTLGSLVNLAGGKFRLSIRTNATTR